MNDLSPATIGLIIAAVVVVLLVIIIVAVRSSRRGKGDRVAAERERAAELRHEADRDDVALREQELQADEAELAAERERLAADRARIHADDMEREAADRRSGLGEARADIHERQREADRIDPDVRRDGTRVDTDRRDVADTDRRDVTDADRRGFDADRDRRHTDHGDYAADRGVRDEQVNRPAHGDVRDPDGDGRQDVPPRR